MQKKSLLILAAILLAGCSNPGQSSTSSPELVDYSDLKIISPTGAPAVALFKQSSNPNYETNATASNIVKSMATGNYDIVVLPTNAGFNAIKSGVDYKIAATITFGNLFVASTGSDTNNVMEVGDKIILFQQNNVPDKIFHYVYGDTFDSSISYVAEATNAAACLKTGKNAAENNEVVDYVLIAQPALTNILNDTTAPTYGKSKVYANLQEKYKEKSNNLELFQASIFVKGTSEKEKVDAFLKDTKESIAEALTNPSILVEKMSSVSNPNAFFAVAPEMAKTVTQNGNGMGLGFKYAYENKKGIENFLKIFNINEVSETSYYK